MKRFLTFSFAVLAALSITACSAKKPAEPSPTPAATATPAPEVEVDLDALKDGSRAFAEQMAAGDFVPVTELFSDSIKTQLTPEVLETTWNETIEGIGGYVGVYECKDQPANGYIIINVILEYEKNGLILSFMYDGSGKIGGLWLNYYSIPTGLETNGSFEEHAIKIGEEGMLLDGILTLPNGEVNDIAILVHGSGQHDMDETIGTSGNKPFRDIAHGLAEKGIASIRYNKRYYQHIAFIPTNLTIRDEVLDDVGHAVEFIKSDSRVSDMKITLIGHSLGGMLAPKLALDNDEIASVISLAGSPRGLEDIILDQNLAEIEKIEFESEEEKDGMLNMIQTEVNRIKNIEAEEEGAQVFGVGTDYWKSLNEIDTPAICEQLDIPFLIMQGEADFQVYPDKDFEAWKTAFDNKSNATFKLYAGLNHLFMPTSGIAGIADYDEANNVDPAVIEDMAAWITENNR